MGSPLRTPTRQSNSPQNQKDKKKISRSEEEDRLGLLQNRDDILTKSFNAGDPKSELSLRTHLASNSSKSASPSPRPNVPGKGMLRDSSYDFQNDVVPVMKTAPRDANDDDEDSEEFDFPKREPDLENQCLSPVTESPNEYGRITPRATKVSFQESELVRRRPSETETNPRSNFGGVGVSGREDQILRCSSSASFGTKPGLMRMKTKSRLMDPPEEVAAANDKRSGRVMQSRRFGKSEEIEEDDPFDDDLPDEYRKAKFSCFTIVQWLSLVLISGALVCSLVIPVLRGKTIWGMQLWKWGVMVLVLICGGLVSGWLIRIVVFFIERNFLLRKRVLYFVYGLRGSVQKFLWLGWVLLAWLLILDKKVEKETNSKVLPFVTKILICLMVGTLIWLVKTLLLKVLAMNFHVSAFFDRIQDALFNQYVIETLSGLAYLEIQHMQEEDDRVMCEVQKLQSAGVHVPADIRASLPNNGKAMGSGRSVASGLMRSPFIGKSPKSTVVGKSPRFSRAPSKREEEQEGEGINIDHLHRLNQKNVSAWNMKRLMNIVRRGVLSTLDEQLGSGIEDDSALQIRSEKEAKAAARRIFENVAKPGSK